MYMLLNTSYIVVQLQKCTLLIGGEKVTRWNLAMTGFVSTAEVDT